MPEYLHPGVYIAEVAAGAKPIDGVSTSTADLIGSEVISKLHRLATAPAPEWTQYNQHEACGTEGRVVEPHAMQDHR